MKKNILIIGAGFSGLSAAWHLSKAGKKVVVLEKEKAPGGLAAGWQEKGWQWSLEKHYHHFFSSDKYFKSFLKETGLINKLFLKTPKTAFFVQDKVINLVSSFKNFRSVWPLIKLRLTNNWQALEKEKAVPWLKKELGKKTFNLYWQPLFKGKFGPHANQISLAWFWARIKKRTLKLGYYQGGFQALADDLVKKLRAKGVKFYFQQEVKSIGRTESGFEVVTNQKSFKSDQLLLTIPLPISSRLLWFLPEKLKKQWAKIEFLNCLTLVLALKQPFLKETYWLNISDESFPFISLIEHTNFISKKRYNDQNLVYLGKYLTEKSPLWQLQKKQLIKLYLPFIQKINPLFKQSWIKKSWLFKDQFAQPVVKTNYRKIKPTIKTPVKGLYLANLTHVYPWDRGINYAIELGQKTATIISNDKTQ